MRNNKINQRQLKPNISRMIKILKKGANKMKWILNESMLIYDRNYLFYFLNKLKMLEFNWIDKYGYL